MELKEYSIRQIGHQKSYRSSDLVSGRTDEEVGGDGNGGNWTEKALRNILSY